jgi:hypothetical protein
VRVDFSEKVCKCLVDISVGRPADFLVIEKDEEELIKGSSIITEFVD